LCPDSSLVAFSVGDRRHRSTLPALTTAERSPEGGLPRRRGWQRANLVVRVRVWGHADMPHVVPEPLRLPTPGKGANCAS